MGGLTLAVLSNWWTDNKAADQSQVSIFIYILNSLVEYKTRGGVNSRCIVAGGSICQLFAVNEEIKY